MKSITLGSDPELHIFDNQEGKVVSSLRILGRDKNDPIDLGDGIKVYSDNALAENSFPPCESISGIMARMGDVFARTQTHLGARYTLLPKAAHYYGYDELKEASLWLAGCNPNIDVYAKRLNPPARFTDDLRTGSFHIHLGHEGLKTNNDRETMVMLLDVFAGCASVIFDKDETATMRRNLYGRAGEFRPTPYGIEYRVLGNWCLRSNLITELVWDLIHHSIHHFEIGDAPAIIEACGKMKTQLAINTNDKTLARQLLEVAALPKKLMDRVENDYGMPDFRASWKL